MLTRSTQSSVGKGNQQCLSLRKLRLTYSAVEETEQEVWIAFLALVGADPSGRCAECDGLRLRRKTGKIKLATSKLALRVTESLSSQLVHRCFNLFGDIWVGDSA